MENNIEQQPGNIITEGNRELQPGDLIWADRSVKGLPYNHCGIYEGGGQVIHFASPEGSEINQETAKVCETTFEHFKDGCPVKVIDIEGSLSPEVTLQNARSFLGTRGYDFTSFNCDHFATWCKTGKYRSLQVDKVKTVLKELDNSVVNIVCEIHDIAEMFKATRLNTVPAEENEIENNIEANSLMTETIPPVPDDENDIQADYEIIDEPSPEGDTEAETDEIAETEDEGEDDEELPPPKKKWYEHVFGVLKTLTYPVAIGIEFLKRIGKFPPIPVNFNHLGAKVRNVIDNIVTSIKVFTGHLTKEQACNERMLNEVALAGSVVIQKQEQVKEALKQTFGKVGSIVKHAVQQVVTRILPAPVREAIKTGAKKVITTVASGIKSFLHKAKEGVKSFVGKVKAKLFG